MTGQDNRNQMLLAKSTDGGATFGSPVKVSDYYDLPDCLTYQGDDAGRACVPEKGSSTKSVFRATNYPSGAVNPRNPNQVSVTFGSYINPNSNESNGCVPNGFSQFGINTYTGVKTPGACNNDILLSVSTDAGATFTGTTTDPRDGISVTNGQQQRTTDQFWQWNAYTQDGQLAVSYFDRQYGSDEFNGSSDVSLSSSGRSSSFSSDRVHVQLDAGADAVLRKQWWPVLRRLHGLTAIDEAHPIWMDTRSQDLFVCPGTAAAGNPPTLCGATEPNGETANDQEIYTRVAGCALRRRPVRAIDEAGAAGWVGLGLDAHPPRPADTRNRRSYAWGRLSWSHVHAYRSPSSTESLRPCAQRPV